MVEKWLVAFNRPYYPSTEEFDTENEARDYAEFLAKEESCGDGQHNASIYVCKIVNKVDIKTCY